MKEDSQKPQHTDVEDVEQWILALIPSCKVGFTNVKCFWGRKGRRKRKGKMEEIVHCAYTIPSTFIRILMRDYIDASSILVAKKPWTL